MRTKGSRLHSSPYVKNEDATPQFSEYESLNGIWGSSGNDVHLGFSDDRGQTWGDSTIVNSAGGSVFRGRPYAAVNTEGVVGVAWDDRRHATGDSCSDVYFAASLDGGSNFLPEIRISSTTACAHTPGNGPIGERYIMGGDYSGVAATADGAFQIIWSDARTGRFLPYTARVQIEQ